MYCIKQYFGLLCLLLFTVNGLPFPNGNKWQEPTLNNRPIIGILAQDTSSALGRTYISATYVKFLEQAGARVVPIRGGQPEEYYIRMVNWTNGALIPGGVVNFATSLLGRSARLVYDAALKLNRNQDYFPIWGTCMGFQLLCYLVQGDNLLKRTDSANISWPLTFTPDFKSSRLFGQAPENIIQILSTEPVTQNEHHYSILTKVFETSKLGKFFKKLSVNRDRKGVEFISTVEGKEFPFYGVQWHPEKPNFNWNTHYNTDHGPDAVRVSQYMANFFVNEARKSSHRFPSVKLEATNLIENYNRTFSSDDTFVDIYYIDPRDT
ncbi:hypothetical protein RRG08_001555 [Elysia crispata]|uniref:folate gamma-glutamyl hydrolase n=1 Tax=Elysia crispata TaxID=231223 RepID=A0AAE1ALY2_9GAST|nr:hypothetical protein RRG08_001555 [Elysia crispata]